MSIAFAETTSSGTSSPNFIIGLIALAVIVGLIVWKKRKKADTKSSSRPTSSKSSKDYTIISISKFQKVVYNQFVVFDLETTGLSPTNDRIVEIGAVRVANGKIVDKFQQFVNPGIPMPAAATKVNHITDEMLKNSPSIKHVLPDFLKFVDGDVLAAHNASFDAGFLCAACSECKLDSPQEFFDTMRLNVYWPDLKDKKLVTFLKAAEIENKGSHRALGDAEATAKLIIKTFDKIK